MVAAERPKINTISYFIFSQVSSTQMKTNPMKFKDSMFLLSIMKL